MSKALTDEVIDKAVEAFYDVSEVGPRGNTLNTWEAIRAAAKVIESALVGDRRDAERYRWLREQMFVRRSRVMPSCYGLYEPLLCEGFANTDDEKFIDQAIDAAIKGKYHE